MSAGFDSIPYGQGEGYNGIGEGWQGSAFGGDPNAMYPTSIPSETTNPGSGMTTGPEFAPTRLPTGTMEGGPVMAPRGSIGSVPGGGTRGGAGMNKPILSQLLGSIFGMPMRGQGMGHRPGPQPRPIARPVARPIARPPVTARPPIAGGPPIAGSAPVAGPVPGRNGGGG